ncbi:nitrite reductase large subunit NirB [Methylococcus capsulatus]|uniref:nitrite reductase large subunit NirB n=1 Tax=Methylococcus capsulatus TaxID=414 RepID=UPI001C52AC61|nr:nitrite reductase large subunit NirB [Methylococcus capsulatus]QXP88594.1 nitrite reductase large subunit NirB [Methylococcus capsulatus]QXP94392.1 nitrite reductase large subunit NirB [Methylococcus capsulatus]UQN10868.1 nitrite reductase large subunit NirB [Methylococcus capsulatus]
MSKPKLVLVGNGMAGVRTLEELLKLAPGKYDITVFGAEPHPNYNRILLSPVLAGEKKLDDIILNDEDWYAGHGITLHKGKTVVAIDRGRRRVRTEDGTVADYDRLLLATGSTPFILPVPGRDLEGVVGFRDIRDVERMLEASEKHRHAVVIGGGLLGLEAANGLKKRGMNVTVVHLLDTLMERQLDKPAATLLQRALENSGLSFKLEAQTEALLGEGRVRAVRFKDGSEIPADLVVMAVGIRPNIELAKAAGIHCERGILVSDTMQTFDPQVYAVGECVQHRGELFGLVAPLFEQAKVCANHLAEFGIARYRGSVTSTKLKVTGIDLFSAGEYQGGPGFEELLFQDPSRGVYKKLVVRDNKVAGAVLYGDTVDGAWYFQMMRDGTDISAFREHILFGQAHVGDSGHGAESHAARLAEDAEVCGCNGVCKKTIVDAIIQKKLFTLDEVRAHTKASASCGSCTGLVEQLLQSTLGSDYSVSPAKKPLCRCTDLTHEEVREAVRTHGPKTIPQLMGALGWRTPDGCHTCRPALNYYLLCQWPGEYRDDPQSRFINERVHANIQKDGTYSVVPRIWGGVTNPRELRAIADVAEKFRVPCVKITGGQRIDLLGVPKARLPAIWAELGKHGLVSGHAYGKSLRTVKTCVGKEWCRFGTQDSTTLGIELEKMTWGSWTPAKVKMAVSGCPRNCAEATIKDFGVVAVDSGWELHVGGNGGVKVRATDFLCKVQTDEEVMEYAAAYLQLYREEARYLERTAHWIERVGLPYVHSRIVDDAEGRKALRARFLESQRKAQIDPWAERAQGAERHEFEPLTLRERNNHACIA